MSIKILICLVLANAFAFSYTATFEDSLKTALSNNKELKAKKYDIEKANYDLKEAKSYNRGKVEFSENASSTNHAGYAFGTKLSQRQASFADFGFDQFLSQMPNLLNPADTSAGSRVLATEPSKLNHPDMVTNFESKIVYEAPLYSGGKLESAAQMAQLQIKANEFKYARDEKLLGLEVLKAYNGAVAAKNFIKITADAKKIAAGFIKKSKKLYGDNLVRNFEVRQAEAAHKSIDVKLQEARTKFTLAIAYLQFLTDDKKIDDVGEFKNFRSDIVSLNAVHDRAVGMRDDYLHMDYNVKTMKEKIKFDSSDFLPVVGVHAEYGTNDELPTIALNKNYYLLAVGLKYTLFDGDLTSIKRQKAIVEHKKAEEYQSYMRDGIALELKQHHENLITEERTLKAKIEVANMSRKTLSDIEEIYDNNLLFRTNMMYLLMQLETLVKAQADVAMSKYNKSIAEANLKLALGESL